MAFLNLPVVLGLVQFVVGYFVKKWPVIPNTFIPAVTYVVALFGYTVAPKEVNAASILDPLMGSGSIFATALLQNIAITGVHSSWKNSVKPALKFTLNSLLGRWIKW